MTNFRSRTLLASAACLLVILGCVVPGLTPVSAPAPTADTVLLVTMVAETVSAARKETASAVTPEPASTATLPPPTETAILITESSASGSLLSKADDGSTLFSDQRADYEVTVPTGWLPVRVNEQEYRDAWSLAETADPAVQAALKSIETEDPDHLRLFVLDTQDGHVQDGFVNTIKLVWDEQSDMSLADETDIVAAAQALPTSTPGLEVMTTELRTTPSGLPVGVITTRIPTVKSDGSVMVLLQEQVFVNLNQGILTITLSTTEDSNDEMQSVFDGMIATLRTLP
jgi:hypothetical protein